jgi:farnesol dehydrogenase
MKVLLTGASGFLGGHVALTLREGGHDVALLARRPQSVQDLGPAFEVIPGDLLRPETLERAVAGRDAVVHVAGLVSRWERDPRLFDRVNVEGTERLIEAALAAGVGRIVYCSSFLALGPTDGRRSADERLAHDGAPRNDYERTKLAAEALVRGRQSEGQPIVIVYPGVVYGPGRLTDGNLLAGVARDLLSGRFPGMIGPGDRRQSLAYVEDVARGFLLALERAEPGTRYMLGGENLTVRETLVLIARAGGVAPPGRSIPYGVAKLVGRLYRWRAQLTGRSPRLTDAEVDIYRHDWAYDSSRAVRELGYELTPAREGIERMVRWLRESGAVPSTATGG